jgi:hypothetical protein
MPSAPRQAGQSAADAELVLMRNEQQPRTLRSHQASAHPEMEGPCKPRNLMGQVPENQAAAVQSTAAKTQPWHT